MSDPAVEAKFMPNAVPASGKSRAAKLARTVRALDDPLGVAVLVALCRPANG